MRRESCAKEPMSEAEAAAAAEEAAARAVLMGADDDADDDGYKEARDAKSVERDLAVRQILARGSRNLRTAHT